MGTVTLDKGTWFKMQDNTDNIDILGKIVEYTKDENNADLYWFQCEIKFDFNSGKPVENVDFISSKRFEQVTRLNLMSDTEGSERYHRLIEMYNAQETLEATQETESESPRLPDINIIQNYSRDTNLRNDKHQVGFSTGDMKTIIRLFEAMPEKTWPRIENLVAESGHQILKFMKRETRQKMIEYKIQWDQTHQSLTFQPGKIYEFENEQHKKTTAIYAGSYFWLTEETNKNHIPDMVGSMLHEFNSTTIKRFTIHEKNSYENENKLKNIYNQYRNTLPSEAITVICKTDNNSKIKLDHKWQDVIFYHYFLGGEIPKEINLLEQDNSHLFKKLALARNDQETIERLEAINA